MVILLLLFLLWCLLLRCRRNHPARTVLTGQRYAHRGLYHKPAIPENSLAAFRRAVNHGFGAELDVHLMRDGELAVIHDSSLLRTAGADIAIEDLTAADLNRYTLEESRETIPLLRQVLPLFRGKAPLIVELKPERGNHAALCEAVAKLLDGYDGDYCIESFDPRVVYWFRKHRPGVCRGQLSHNFLKDGKNTLPLWMKFVITNLLSNFLTCPDFVAYGFRDRKQLSVRLCRLLWRPQMFHWTITTREDLLQAESEGAVGIFEQFIP